MWSLVASVFSLHPVHEHRCSTGTCGGREEEREEEQGARCAHQDFSWQQNGRGERRRDAGERKLDKEAHGVPWKR